MARQSGPYYITGCYDNICFYQLQGNYYARTKSSLTAKRVKKDPAFKATMRYASLLANASKLASALYNGLPKESKGIAVYRLLTGKIMRLLQEGKTHDDILRMNACGSGLHANDTPARINPANESPLSEAHIQAPVITSQLTADMIIETVFSDCLMNEPASGLMVVKIAPP
jgi:hypothetical protein